MKKLLRQGPVQTYLDVNGIWAGEGKASIKWFNSFPNGLRRLFPLARGRAATQFGMQIRSQLHGANVPELAVNLCRRYLTIATTGIPDRAGICSVVG